MTYITISITFIIITFLLICFLIWFFCVCLVYNNNSIDNDHFDTNILNQILTRNEDKSENSNSIV